MNAEMRWVLKSFLQLPDAMVMGPQMCVPHARFQAPRGRRWRWPCARERPAGLRVAARRPPAPKAAAAKGGGEGADAAAGSEDSAFFAGSASFKLPQVRHYTLPHSLL